MECIVEVHPSHLPVVAATLLAAPVSCEERRLWHCRSQTELAKEYARAFALVRPGVDEDEIVMHSLFIAWSPFKVDETSVRVAIQFARCHRPPCPHELLGHPWTCLLGQPWTWLRRSFLQKKRARTCARPSSWMLPMELRDVWPRIFAEVAASTVSARRWREQKDSKTRAARVEGIVDAMRDGQDTCSGCLAYVLQDREDLRELMVFVAAAPSLWRDVAWRMQLEGPLP